MVKDNNSSQSSCNTQLRIFIKQPLFMAKNKTTENKLSVMDYIAAIADENKRKDCLEMIQLTKKQTGFTPKMWGSAIVGFGSYHYKYESGHEGDAPLAAFAARANAIVLYLSLPPDKREAFLQKFGKHKTGKGCIYVQKLADVDINVFSEMIVTSVNNLKEKYPL